MMFREITVAGPPRFEPVLQALERVLPVRFVRKDMDAPVDHCAALELSYAARANISSVTNHTFRVLGGQPTLTPGRPDVCFADDCLLHECLRGRTISHDAFPVCGGLPPTRPDTVLANAAGMPVWAAWTRNGSVDEVTCVPPPELTGDVGAVDFLHGGNFLRLLPLYHFVHRALTEDGWVFPAARASFMFDDPNLHRPSYGYISYLDIIRHSESSNYHVAFAMVPFDTWYTDRTTAVAFRSHAWRVSLLLHGNDHTRAELARVLAPGIEHCIAAQALGRISRFESRSGVRVCRTMAPPHGACSNSMMEALLGVGIESLFCSAWSLRDWDCSRGWAGLGMAPAELIGEGFAVIPRFRLSSKCEGSAVICALLGQPIVPVGHHHDLRDGAGVLDTAAATINGIPGAIWGNTEYIARSNFLHRTQPKSHRLDIVPYSTRIQVSIPQGINAVSIHDLRRTGESSANELWLLRSSSGSWIGAKHGEEFLVSPGSELTFQLATLGRVQPSGLVAPRTSITAPIRRLLCESRDRLAPMARALKAQF